MEGYFQLKTASNNNFVLLIYVLPTLQTWRRQCILFSVLHDSAFRYKLQEDKNYSFKEWGRKIFILTMIQIRVMIYLWCMAEMVVTKVILWYTNAIKTSLVTMHANAELGSSFPAVIRFNCPLRKWTSIPGSLAGWPAALLTVQLTNCLGTAAPPLPAQNVQRHKELTQHFMALHHRYKTDKNPIDNRPIIAFKGQRHNLS